MALGDALTPTVFPNYLQGAVIATGTQQFRAHNIPGLTAGQDSSLTTGARRPSSGQIYPRGTR